MQYVAYIRVSTQQQSLSGLGLDAQQAAVDSFITQRGGELILPTFVEQESGKKNDRPVLLAALAKAKKHKATLLVAKIDRLARNVAFISTLLESGVEVVACDMPEANRFMFHIMAAVAEHERQAISDRTKAALAEARKQLHAKGERLGNPTPERSLEIGRATISANADNRHAMIEPVVRELRAQGLSLRKIAATLQNRGIKTPRGNTNWSAASVRLFVTEA